MRRWPGSAFIELSIDKQYLEPCFAMYLITKGSPRGTLLGTLKGTLIETLTGTRIRAPLKEPCSLSGPLEVKPMPPRLPIARMGTACRAQRFKGLGFHGGPSEN